MLLQQRDKCGDFALNSRLFSADLHPMMRARWEALDELVLDELRNACGIDTYALAPYV
ncbi:MAG: hypothetical protein WCB95_07185 [Aeromicrobium sp.]